MNTFKYLRLSAVPAAMACMLGTSPAQTQWDPADSDLDGLSDAWEDAHFGSLEFDGVSDNDGDSVPNSLEFSSGRNPTLAETVAGTPDWHGVPGALRCERWDGISGLEVTDLTAAARFHDPADQKSFVAAAEIPAGSGIGNYGLRLEGFLIAPVSGNYRFHIASDDTSELWLGSGSGRFTRSRIASVPGYTLARSWKKYPEQTSAVIHLEAGTKYYLESLMKQSAGGDNLAIGWTYTPDDPAIPAQTAIAVIPGRLADAQSTVVLESFSPDPDDADMDMLPDSWELANGLKFSDNGKADNDHDGFNNYQEWISGGNPMAAGGNTGYVLREQWRNISGVTVSSLTGSSVFPKPANSISHVSSALSFGTTADNYGQRVKGAIVPPRSGKWRFWIASDESSEFWLSGNWQATGKRKAAFVSASTGPAAYDTTPSQKSTAFALDRDVPYYFEILHKEGTGSDHVSVAWAYEPDNLALAANGATASQSSTSGGMDAGRAIDGNTSGVVSSSSISQTDDMPNSWWRVDFGGVSPLNRVVLFNRGDDLQNQKWLSNFRVSAIDASGNEIIGRDFCTSAGQYVNGSLTWDLGTTVNASGVKVVLLGQNLMGNGCLSLAEVQACEWVPEATRQTVPLAALQTATPDSADADGDGLPDAWEIQYGLNPTDNGSTTPGNGEYGDADGDGVPNLYEYINGSAPNAANGIAGSLQRDTWWNISGGSIHDLLASPSFLDFPSLRDNVTSWQTSGRGNYYGQRLRGLYTPLSTGLHTFWITGDNSCALYLNDGSLVTGSGPNDTCNAPSRKFGKRLIASVGGEDHHFGAPASGPLEYDKYPSQKSRAVWLVAGTKYFIEVLHKQDVEANHLAVAVQPPGGTRDKIPFTALTSFTYDIADADDDDLPDTWESQYQLDPWDNGRINAGIEGARGDADGDQLTNREEYLLGTNPMDADGDGDGLSDHVEVHSLGSDPNDGNSGTGAILTDLTGSAGSPASGQWIAGPNDTLLSLDRRGSATWDFSLAANGCHLLEILATPQGNTWAGKPLTIGVTISRVSDSKQWDIGTFALRDDEGKPTRVLALLPSLPAGCYRATLALRNISESRNIRIDRLRVLAPSGSDADNNGIPDWIETRLGERNGLLSVSPACAGGGACDVANCWPCPVSPACVEGIASDVAKSWLTIAGQNVPLTAGIDRNWYANVGLPADGEALPMSASFEDGTLVQEFSIVWTPTNLFAAADPITVRTGDSLRLTAHPGEAPDSGPVIITGAGPVIETTANVPVARTFNTVGTFEISFTHTDAGSNPTTASTSIRVVNPSFGPALEVRTDRWRGWALPTSITSDMPIEWDSRLTVSEPNPSASPRLLKVAATGDRPVHLVARTAAGSTIAARGTVDPYLIGDPYDTGYVEILETFPDGSIHGRISVVADRLPAGGYVEIQIWAGGAQFDDGNNIRKLHAGAFDANGVALVDVYYPSREAISSFCAYYRLKTDSGALLSDY